MRTSVIRIVAVAIIGISVLTMANAQEKQRLDQPQPIVKLSGIELAFAAGDTNKIKVLSARFDSVAAQCQQQSEFCKSLIRFHRIFGVASK